jgi:hypothetical protein
VKRAGARLHLLGVRVRVPASPVQAALEASVRTP